MSSKLYHPSTLHRIIEILSDGHVHDNASIANKLKRSPSTIRKTIKKLQAYGILIASTRGVGYQLREPLILLDKNKLTQLLNTPKLKISVFDSITSTQDYLKNLSASQDDHLCLAEEQTKGRGRLEKIWHSPFGKNIYLSYLKTFHQDINHLSGLSLVVALAIRNAVSPYIPQEGLQIKWPNDIWFNREKLAGILIDLQVQKRDVTRSLIGIGLNVNMASINVGQACTSLYKITGNFFDRNEIVASILQNLTDYLEKFQQNGLTFFFNEWKKFDALFGKKIHLSTDSQLISGTAQGINEQGHLGVLLETGEKKFFSSIEASLVK